MQYIGVDIIEINRVENAIKRWGESFLERIYTASEQATYKDNTLSLAARFAAKEAVIKALDSPGLSPSEIEVLSSDSGKPIVTLYGKAKQKASEMGIAQMVVSLSHSQDYAVAFTVGLAEAEDT
ncbi:MAG: holo-ACP synthase [Dehalococcoidia bacterium]|nr:holo-ACP synthase [Dehalococcoidia bacterium]